MKKKKTKFYAVRNTNQIFEDWKSCESVVKGLPGADFKSFATREQAEAFLKGTVVVPKESLAVSYESSSGISGSIQVAEELDPFTMGLNGFVYAVDGSFNTTTGVYGGAFACYDSGTLVGSGSQSGSKENFATARNVAGEITAFGLAIEDAIKRGLTSITIICDYEGIFRWAAPSTVKVNGVACWGVTNSSPISKYHAYLMSLAYMRGLHQIDFIWVRGHSGVSSNELVDKLAKESVGL